MAKHTAFWLLLFALFSLPVTADPPAGYAFVSYDAGLAQAKQNGRPVFLYFGRYGCGWCDKTNRGHFRQAGAALQRLLRAGVWMPRRS